MRAGARSCLVQVWRTPPADVTGEPNPNAVLLREVYGWLYPQRGYEQFRGGDRQGQTFYWMRLDYLDGADLTEADIIRFDGLTFNIVAVMRDLSTRKSIDLQLIEQKYGA